MAQDRQSASRPEPIALLGYSVQLPQGISDGEKLVELIRTKKQNSVDFVERGCVAPYVYDEVHDGNPWKLRVSRGNFFDADEGYDVDCRFFRVTEKEQRFISVSQVMMLEMAWRALEHAGITAEEIHRTRTGVFVGGFDPWDRFNEAPDETSLRSSLMSSLADRIAYFLGTHGPTMATETACSSSMVALSMAVACLRKGDCDTAIVATGNKNDLRDYVIALQACGVVAEDGSCHPFDQHLAKGMMRCEGWGCLILRRMSDAVRQGNRVLCSILNASAGSAGAAEGATEGSGRTYEAPNAHGITELVTNCCRQAGVPLEHVRYLEAHATGATVGDLVELQGLAKAFRTSHHWENNPLRIASIKGNIGHAEIAAGIFSLVKAVEMVRQRTFLPTGGVVTPRTDFDWKANNLRLALDEEPFPKGVPVYVGVNSFGIGGGYAHVIVGEAPPAPRPVVPRPLTRTAGNDRLYLLPLAAATEDHLCLYKQVLAEHLKAHMGALNLRDVCGTMALHRSRLGYRRTYVARSLEDLTAQLCAEEKRPLGVAGDVKAGGVAMVFTGQGAQWLGNGEKLMVFSVYRRAVEAVDGLFRSHAGWSLREKMASLTAQELVDTQYAQPVTFMLQVALFELLRFFRIAPSVVMGHSAGEVAAAYAAGLLTLEDAVAVVYHRSQEQQKLAGSGRMLALGMSMTDALHLIAKGGQDTVKVEIACVNSPQSVVLGGPVKALEFVVDLLPQGIFRAFVPGNIAFHCSLTEPILPNVAKRLSFLNDRQPSTFPTHPAVPFISTVTGSVLRKSADVDYWVRNVRSPVKFQQAVEALFTGAAGVQAPSIVIEVGPHKTLAAPLMQVLQSLGHEATEVVNLLKRKEDDGVMLLQGMGQLIERGLPVGLDGWYKEEGYAFIDLPAHPFIRKPLRNLHLLRRDLLPDSKGLYALGPVAGQCAGVQRTGPARAEISDRTCSQMLDHKMGGSAIVPGMFYVEAAIEAFGETSCTMANVDFKAMCKIPMASRGDYPAIMAVVMDSEGVTAESSRMFEVRTCPMLEEDNVTVHCVGRVIDSKLVDHNGELTTEPSIPSGFGLMTPNHLKDVGVEGLKRLAASHTKWSAKSQEEAYEIVNLEGVTEYGPTFRVIQSLQMDIDRTSMFAKLHYPSSAWAKMGGKYGVQLLDGILQCSFFDPDRDIHVVSYAGGFEVGHFLRQPTDDEVFVHLRLSRDETLATGRNFVVGDAEVYDVNGRLLVSLKGIYSIFGSDMGTVRLLEMAWEPYSATHGANCLDKLMAMQPQDDPMTASSSPEKRHPDDHSDRAAVARFIKELAVQKQAAAGGLCVLRVLEMVEDERVVNLVQSLSALDGIQSLNVVVEVYVGTHDQSIVAGLDVGVPAYQSSWLRTRRACFPGALKDLQDFGFDVIVLSDYAVTGCKVWDNVDDTLRFGWRLARHGAVLVTCGFWEDTTDCRLADYMEALKPYVDEVTMVGTGREGMVAARLRTEGERPGAEGEKRRMLLVSNRPELAETFAGMVESASVSQWVFDVVFSGAGHKLDDTATADDWIRELAPILGVGSLAAKLKEQGIALPEKSEGRPRLESIVLLDGVVDDSRLCYDAVYRAIQFCRAGHALHDGQEDVTNDRRALWFVTTSVFTPPFIFDRASLYGFTRSLDYEMAGIKTRYADLKSVDCLPHLARLIVSAPPERNFVLDGERVMAQRYFVVNQQDLAAKPVSADDPDMAYYCDVVRGKPTNPGQVAVVFKGKVIPEPEDDEVVVDIHAAALNFRDVLLSVSLLPVQSFDGSYYGKHMGMEASGTVRAVGKNVKHLTVGDRVVTSEPDCFASRIAAPAERVYKVPDNLSLEDAAATQSVFSTAHHALVNLARIRKGDKVLVHAAAGGVGHAAITICQHYGAGIYATASKAKRSAVASLGVDPSRIYDSRSTSWFGDLMRDTGNRGVDVVLNSLAGKHQKLGVQALTDGGRFLEIGKIDIYENAGLGLLALRKNATFAAIDMDRLALSNPEFSARVTTEVFEHLRRGDYKPIPYVTFTMDRIKDAIEHMKTGRQIGKILLVNHTQTGGTLRPVCVQAKLPQMVFGPRGTYLVTGAAGGFGSRIVNYAYACGARHFVVTVTRDPSRAHTLFKTLIDSGCRIDVVEADVSKEEDVASVVEFCRKLEQPLRAIFHSAGGSIDQTLPELDASKLKELAGPKNMGAWYLHEQTKDMTTIENFCLVSSSSADLSTRGNMLYAATNTMLNAFVRYRRSLGLPACSLNMTSLADVGIVASNSRLRALQLKQGLDLVPSQRAITDLMDIIGSGKQTLTQVQVIHHLPFFAGNRASFFHNVPDVFTLGASTDQRRVMNVGQLTRFVIEVITDITKVSDVLNTSMLANLGIDSLSLVDLTSRIKQATGVDVPLSNLTVTTTVAELAKVVSEMQAKQMGAAVAGAEGQVHTGHDGAGGSVPPAAAESIADVMYGQARLVTRVSSAFEEDISSIGHDPAQRAETQAQSDAVAVPCCLPWRASRSTSARPQSSLVLSSPPPTVAQNPAYGGSGCMDPSRGDVGASSLAASTAWFRCFRPNPEARKRLIIVPSAGAGILSFVMWNIRDVEIVVAHLPGRDGRTHEEPIRDIAVLGEKIAEAISSVGYLEDMPLAVMGHSWGAYVALEICRTLKTKFMYTPERLIVAAMDAPHHCFLRQFRLGKGIVTLPLVHLFLHAAGGLPEDFWKYDGQNGEYTRAIQPDLWSIRDYRPRRKRPVDCPISVFLGRSDPLVIHNPLRDWGLYTTQKVSQAKFPGKHFFIFDKETTPAFLDDLEKLLLGV